VVLYNRYTNTNLSNHRTCPVDCRVSTNRSHVEYAHGVLFHAPTSGEMPSRKKDGQADPNPNHNCNRNPNRNAKPARPGLDRCLSRFDAI